MGSLKKAVNAHSFKAPGNAMVTPRMAEPKLLP